MSTSTNAVEKASAGQRIHYLDNLRAWAMLLGVVLHAGLAYAKPAQEVWLATDTQSSVAIDVSIWFIHLFRMGLFFLLSGYFGALVVARKGVRKFLINRLVRVAAPMLLFFPFLLGAMFFVISLALSLDYEKRGLIGLIESAIQSGAPSQESSLGWMHLWFLYYLLLFSLLACVCAGRQLPTFPRRFQNRWLAALAPLALVPSVALAGIPIPPAESFVPQLWPFGFYGLFYWAGWQLFGRERWLNDLQPYCWPITLGSLILFVPYYSCLPTLDINAAIARKTDLSPWALAVESLLTAYLSVTLSLSALLLGQRYLAGHSPTMRFVADSSYWIYLIHIPVVLLLQVVMVPLAWNVWLKFGLTTLLTFAFCMATYVVFVRYTPLGWLLNGKRTFP